MKRLSDLHRDWLHAQLRAHRRPSPVNVRRANRALGRLVLGLMAVSSPRRSFPPFSKGG